MIGSKTVFFDSQYFHGSMEGEYIVKELTLMSLCDKFFIHRLLKPPYGVEKLPQQRRKAASWVSRQHNGLTWDSGVYPYVSELRSCLQNLIDFDPDIIYVKGNEKKRCLEYILAEQHFTTLRFVIYDLETIFNTPAVKILKTVYPTLSYITFCHYHSVDGACSLQTVALLIRWYLDNKHLLLQ
jgi:hypothetical protein